MGSAIALLQLAYLILLRPLIHSQFLELAAVATLFMVGVIIGRALYYQRSHVVVSYDEEGFLIAKGSKKTESHLWNEFRNVSLFADSSGQLNVRMYFEKDGLYVDIPVSRAGGDAYELRSFVQRKLKS